VLEYLALLAALPPLSKSPDAVGLKTPRFTFHAGFSLPRKPSRTHKALIGRSARRRAGPLHGRTFCCYFLIPAHGPNNPSFE
jgi:hypothetical protein